MKNAVAEDVKSVKATTVADFLAAEESPSQYYQLTGTVSNIKMTFMAILILQMKAVRYMFMVFLQAGKAQANSSDHWVLLKVTRLLYAVFVPASMVPLKWEVHSSFLK